MDFSFSPNQKMIREVIRDFSKTHIKPFILEWDEKQYFPTEILKKLGGLGFMGILVPENYGGSGMNYYDYIVIVEEFSKVCPSLGLSIAAHNSLYVNHILSFGSEEQKQKWLPPLAKGEKIGGWGLTEQNAGSDAKNIETTAKEEGAYFVLNGSKNFISNAVSGDIFVVMGRTGEKGDSKGMTAFVLEKGMKGFSAGKKENKLGMRSAETGTLIFDDCKVPKENILGKIGDGFTQAMTILDGGRISIAALSLGISKGAFEGALQYSKEREQFGKAISKFQGIAFKLADMEIQIQASELLTYKAAFLKEQNQKCTKESSVAKLFASESCVSIASEAVQIHGGYGYTKEYSAEMFYRDSKLCTIGEGTSEIQKLIISRELLK